MELGSQSLNELAWENFIWEVIKKETSTIFSKEQWKDTIKGLGSKITWGGPLQTFDIKILVAKWNSNQTGRLDWQKQN